MELTDTNRPCGLTAKYSARAGYCAASDSATNRYAERSAKTQSQARARRPMLEVPTFSCQKIWPLGELHSSRSVAMSKRAAATEMPEEQERAVSSELPQRTSDPHESELSVRKE